MSVSSRRSLGSVLACMIATVLLVACFEDDPPAPQLAAPSAPPPTAPACVPPTCDGRCEIGMDTQCGSVVCGACSAGFLCTGQGTCTSCIQGCPAPSLCSPDGTCAGPLAALDLDESVEWVDLDVAIDGKPPALDCKTGPSLRFVDTLHQRLATYPVSCSVTDGKTWQVRAAIPRSILRKQDTFDVTLLPGLVAVPAFPYEAIVGQLTSGTISNPTVDFDHLPVVPLALRTVPSTTISAEVRVEGATPTKDLAACAQKPDQVLANVVFSSKTGVHRTQAITCASPSWKLQLALPLGTYDVSVEPDANAIRYFGVNLFPAPVSFPGKIVSGAQGFTFDEKGVRLAGDVRVNGSYPAIPPGTCNGNAFDATYDFGYVDIVDTARGTGAHVPITCTSGWHYDVRLPAASSYAVTFVRGGYSYLISELSAAPVAFGPGFPLAQDKSFTLDMSVLDVTLTLASNGKPLNATTFCTANPGGYVGDLLLSGAGGSAKAAAFCSSTTAVGLAPELRLAEGNYTIALAPRADLDTGLGGSSTVYLFAPAGVALGNPTIALPGTNSAVYVSPTIQGKAPTFDAAYCKANPMTPIAHVTAEGKVNGLVVSAAADLTCASNSVRFDLPPGTYDFHSAPPYPANGAMTNVPGFTVSRSSVVVPAASNVIVDVPNLTVVEGDVHFGGSMVSKASSCALAGNAPLLDVHLVEPTLGYDFTTTLTCDTDFHLKQSLPPGTWNIYASSAVGEQQSQSSVFAPYDYEIAHQLRIAGPGR